MVGKIEFASPGIRAIQRAFQVAVLLCAEHAPCLQSCKTDAAARYTPLSVAMHTQRCTRSGAERMDFSTPRPMQDVGCIPRKIVTVISGGAYAATQLAMVDELLEAPC